MRDLGCWHEPGPKYPTGLLVLASGQKHPMSWRATLVHELLHIAVPDYEADDHGPLFLAEANKVGKLLGLDECEPCDAWVWPSHNGSWEPPPDANILD